MLLRFTSILFVLEEMAEIRLFSMVLMLSFRSYPYVGVVTTSLSFTELGLMKLLVLTAVHPLCSSLYELIALCVEVDVVRTKQRDGKNFWCGCDGQMTIEGIYQYSRYFNSI